MIRVLIADNFPIVRKGVQQLIKENLPGATAVDVGDLDSLYRLVTSEKWDVLLCDMNMNGTNEMELLHQLKMIDKNLRVLVMSSFSEDQFALRLLKAGASGYLQKDTAPEDLIAAIRQVAEGKKYITPGVAEKIARQLGNSAVKQPHEYLSNREYEVFLMLASGQSNAAIAERLLLSAATVSTYRSRLMDKLGRRSNTELVRYALEKKLI